MSTQERRFCADGGWQRSWFFVGTANLVLAPGNWLDEANCGLKWCSTRPRQRDGGGACVCVEARGGRWSS